MDIEYKESLEIKDTAKKLQERYYPFIGNVDLDEIFFSEIIGFKPEKAPVWLMSGLTQQWARDLIASQTQQKQYCFSAWSDEWSEISSAKKEWIIFRAIYSISPQGKGKLRPFDVQDYGFIVEYFVRVGIGPYWQDKDELPSLLAGNDVLPLVLPMSDDE
jgi:hypothetical protein